MIRFAAAAGLLAVSISNAAADGASEEQGLRLSIVGGCHDCHTDGYAASGGQIDPENALRGSAIGFQGSVGHDISGKPAHHALQDG